MGIEELDEYLEKKRFKDGLNRCNRILKKPNADALVIVYKARFLYALGQHDEADATITSLLERKPPIKDPVILEAVDTSLLERASESSTSPVLTSGDISNKLWKAAVEDTRKSFVPQICQDRYEHAIRQGRLIDAHHALMQWKKHEPNRKDLRFTHAAVFHLISQKAPDQQSSSMFTQLATRTAEQLAPSSATNAELETVVNVLAQHDKAQQLTDIINANTSFSQILNTNPTAMKSFLDVLVKAGQWQAVLDMTSHMLLHLRGDTTIDQHNYEYGNDFKTWKLWTEAHARLGTEGGEWDKQSEALPDKSRFKFLAQMWFLKYFNLDDAVVGVALRYFSRFGDKPFCASELRDFLLAVSPEYQDYFRKTNRVLMNTWAESDVPDKRRLLCFTDSEVNTLRIECLLNIGGTNKPNIADIYKFVAAVFRLRKACETTGQYQDEPWLVCMVTALFKAHELEPSGRHLLMALCVLNMCGAEDAYMHQVLTTYLSHELGLPSFAIETFLGLGVKEIQLDSASHIGLTRISIQSPIPSKDRTIATRDPYDLLNAALKMFEPTIDRIADQQASCISSSRPDLILDLDALRTSLQTSIQRRILLLEIRRLERLTNRPAQTRHTISPRTVAFWTTSLSDTRDFQTCENYDAGPPTAALERRIMSGGKVPNASWVSLNLWIDDICALISAAPSLLAPQERYFHPPPAVDAGMSEGCTPAEVVLIPAWEALAVAAVLVLVPEGARPTPAPPKTGVAQAMATLRERIETLPFSPAVTTEGTTVPNVAGLQTSFLTMDFLKAVQRFCAACGDVGKKKRVGAVVQGAVVGGVEEEAKRQFERVREFAGGMQKEIKDGELRVMLEGTWGWVLSGRIEVVEVKGREEMGDMWRGQAELVGRMARSAWEGVLAVRFEG
ncbi:hypothetical protein B9Z65_7198 [Elsinoe australis]|uniref:Uncharacterized protein n=1 Tax=Elsinoe australis TaxID=40998 RepID=A0A2P7Z649_9PEZI|nr:hypothetical protein B9Z65_7198 [Elsinoe australis]